MPSNACSCVGQNAAVLGVPNRALRCVKQSLVPAYISMFIIIILIMIMIMIILCIIYNIFRHRSSPYKLNHYRHSLHREGDPKRWSTALITALCGWEKSVPRGQCASITNWRSLGQQTTLHVHCTVIMV